MWNVEYFETERGDCPVAEFIDSLDAKSQAKVARALDLLEEFGTNLGTPYTKHIEKQLWELRVRHGTNRYRVIYFLAAERTFVLLHGFTKKTDALSRGDIETAQRRRTEYLSHKRHNS